MIEPAGRRKIQVQLADRFVERIKPLGFFNGFFFFPRVDLARNAFGIRGKQAVELAVKFRADLAARDDFSQDQKLFIVDNPGSV